MEAVTYVLDLSRSASFYSQVLGLVVRESGDGYCVMDGPGGTLTLVRVPEELAAGIDLADPPERREQTPIKVVFPVTDIAGTRALALSFGGVIDPVDAEWHWQGSVRCDGQDPEGNVLQVSSPVTKTPNSSIPQSGSST